MCDEEMTGTGPVYGPGGRARHATFLLEQAATSIAGRRFSSAEAERLSGLSAERLKVLRQRFECLKTVGSKGPEGRWTYSLADVAFMLVVETFGYLRRRRALEIAEVCAPLFGSALAGGEFPQHVMVGRDASGVVMAFVGDLDAMDRAGMTSAAGVPVRALAASLVMAAANLEKAARA